MAFNALTDFVPSWASEEEKKGKMVFRKCQEDLVIDFEQNKRKRIFIRWHRQLGKDIICWWLLTRHAIMNSGNYIYIFPVGKQAKKALWNKVDDKMGRVIHFLHGGNKDMILSENSNEMFLRFKAWCPTEKAFTKESTIQIMGMDGANVSDNVGQTLSGAVLSEAALYEDYPTLMMYLRPALKAKKGFLVVNSTPRGKNHFYKLEQVIKDDPRWFISVQQNLWPEKPNFSNVYDIDEIWQEAKEDGKEDWEVEQEWGVSYEAKVKGAIYGQNIKDAEAAGRLLQDFKFNKSIPVDTYWDLGTDDDMVCWFKQQTEKGEVLIDYFEDNSGMGYDDLAVMLADRGYRYGKIQLPWDGNRRVPGRVTKTNAQLFRESLRAMRVSANVQVSKRDPTKWQGVLRTRQRFNEYSWDMSNSNVVKGLERLRQHHRKKSASTGEFTSEEAKSPHIHCADAFRNLTSDYTKSNALTRTTQNNIVTGEDDDGW